MNVRLHCFARTLIIQHSAFIICFLCLSTPVFAQVIRLPAVVPAEQSPPGHLVSHPDSTAEILQAPGETGVAPASPPDGPQLPPGVRNGFFQKVLFDATWLAPGGSDGMGTNDLQLQSIFALPCPKPTSPLVITPGFAVHYLQGPQNVDLPPRLYEGYTQFRWMSQVHEKLGVDLAITPGVYSDFNQESSKAFRLTGHGAAAWSWNDQVKIAIGVAYLDMPETNIIPIGGLVWTPSEEWKLDLIFPHPKIARRVYWGDNFGNDVQDWIYIAGEFANDAWAMEQFDGSSCQVALRDYRFIMGIERKVIGGLSSRFEVGYVFGRRIRYTSEQPDFYPSDTVMLRGGLTY